MSKLEELLQKFCPDGVEYKKLGEIAVCQKAKNKAHITEVAYSITQRGLVPTSDYFGEKTKITSSDTSGYYLVYKDWFVYSPSRIDVGSINYLREDGPVIVSPLDVVFSVDATAIRPGFLLIYLTSHFGMFQILSHRQGIEGTGRKTLPFSEFAKIKVPVPPIAIQDEVLCTLGKFAGLISELTAELAARKKQYEYYRDRLLTFDAYGGATSSVTWRTLGELFEFKNGINKGKEFFGKGTPIVNFTDVFHKGKLTADNILGRIEATEDEIRRYGVKRGDVFFTRTSETKEEIGMASVLVEDIPSCIFSGFVLRARPTTDLLLPEYCAYCFSATQIRKEIVRYASFTTRALTSGSILSKIQIAIPSLKVQKRLVHVLDNFDAICSDLNIGLPAEIEARKKQYEFYRDALLTFAATGEIIVDRQ